MLLSIKYYFQETFTLKKYSPLQKNMGYPLECQDIQILTNILLILCLLYLLYLFVTSKFECDYFFKSQLDKPTVKKVVVHIEDREQVPLERFVFEIDQITDQIIKCSAEELEKRFADFILKIAIAELDKTPKGKFSIDTKVNVKLILL